MFENLQLETAQGVVTLTLDRPSRQNAMNRRLVEELDRALDLIEADDQVKALVLTGAGSAFCSGFDLKEQAERRPRGAETWHEMLSLYNGTILRFWHCRVPTIAAVNGPCLAGGFELALACDLTIASDRAVFGEPELLFGAGIVSMLLPWLVNPKQAKEIILLGRDDLDAAEALRLGIVNRVVPIDRLLSEAVAAAKRLSVVDPFLMRQTKKAINGAYAAMGMERALAQAVDIDIQVEAAGTTEKHQFLDLVQSAGMKAALEWRAARFAKMSEPDADD